MVSLRTSACVFAGIAAIGLINEALDEGDPAKTLDMLQNPSAKLTDVDPSVAQHYHDKLLEARREKAHVRHSCTHNIHRFLGRVCLTGAAERCFLHYRLKISMKIG